MNRKWHNKVGGCIPTHASEYKGNRSFARSVGFAFSGVFGAFLFLLVIGFFTVVNGQGAYAQPRVKEGASGDKAPLKAEDEVAEGEKEEEPAREAEETGDEKDLEDEEGDGGEDKGDAGSTLKESEKTPAHDVGKESVSAGGPVDEKVKPRPRTTERSADEMPRPVGRGKESQTEDSKVKSGRTEEKSDPKGEEQKKSKGYEPAGDTAVVGGIGLQYGLTDDSVGGFKLNLSYGYRLTDWMWFDAQANFTFGGNCIGESPAEGEPKEYACNNVRGFGIEAVAGVQWKFYGIEKWQAPVVPFVRAGLGVVAIITNGPNDGLALVARGSGGVRYHFFPWFAVGGELGVSLGPAFRNHLDTGFFAALDLVGGAEFHF